MTNDATRPLERFCLPTGLRLALLWASLMSLYIYNDYFELYLPGTIEHMSAGRMGPLGPATDTVLVGVSLMLAVPAVMIFLSAALPPVVSKWLNVLLGIAYTAIEALTFIGSRPFYQIVVGLEVAITLLIVFYALRWPRRRA